MISQVRECCLLAHHIVHLSTTAKLVRGLYFQGIQMVRNSVWQSCLPLGEGVCVPLIVGPGAYKWMMAPHSPDICVQTYPCANTSVRIVASGVGVTEFEAKIVNFADEALHAFRESCGVAFDGTSLVVPNAPAICQRIN